MPLRWWRLTHYVWLQHAGQVHGLYGRDRGGVEL